MKRFAILLAASRSCPSPRYSPLRTPHAPAAQDDDEEDHDPVVRAVVLPARDPRRQVFAFDPHAIPAFGRPRVTADFVIVSHPHDDHAQVEIDQGRRADDLRATCRPSKKTASRSGRRSTRRSGRSRSATSPPTTTPTTASARQEQRLDRRGGRAGHLPPRRPRPRTDRRRR